MTAFKQWAKAFLYGGTKRFCVVCGHSARLFRTYGSVPRKDAVCPFCGAFERHRLAMHFLRSHTDLFDGLSRRLLHVAPEAAFEPIFRQVAGAGYLSADLLRDDVMERMDITDIHHPDNSFDVIYCSHVLEHVSDDRKAMREFCRVLRPSGWAMLNVPINAGFRVALTSPADLLSPSEIDRQGLGGPGAGEIYFCRKLSNS